VPDGVGVEWAKVESAGPTEARLWKGHAPDAQAEERSNFSFQKHPMSPDFIRMNGNSIIFEMRLSNLINPF
jgi:hypothetical protein